MVSIVSSVLVTLNVVCSLSKLQRSKTFYSLVEEKMLNVSIGIKLQVMMGWASIRILAKFNNCLYSCDVLYSLDL